MERSTRRFLPGHCGSEENLVAECPHAGAAIVKLRSELLTSGFKLPLDFKDSNGALDIRKLPREFPEK